MGKLIVIFATVKEGKNFKGDYRYQALIVADERGNHVDINYYGKHSFKAGENCNIIPYIKYDSNNMKYVMSTMIQMPEDLA